MAEGSARRGKRLTPLSTTYTTNAKLGINFVATNVPGPKMALYMGGQKLREMMFWVPQTGDVGIGISILSYQDHVHFGLIADGRLMPDPDAVIRRFGPEFEKLLYLAMLSDWEEQVRPWDAEMLRASLLEGVG